MTGKCQGLCTGKKQMNFNHIKSSIADTDLAALLRCALRVFFRLAKA